jgi:hypothetical protein
LALDAMQAACVTKTFEVSKMNRIEQVRFRVTSPELHKLDEIARLTRRTRSDVLRQLIHHAEIVPARIAPIRVPPLGSNSELGQLGQLEREVHHHD